MVAFSYYSCIAIFLCCTSCYSQDWTVLYEDVKTPLLPFDPSTTVLEFRLAEIRPETEAATFAIYTFLYNDDVEVVGKVVLYYTIRLSEVTASSSEINAGGGQKCTDTGLIAGNLQDTVRIDLKRSYVISKGDMTADFSDCYSNYYDIWSELVRYSDTVTGLRIWSKDVYDNLEYFLRVEYRTLSRDGTDDPTIPSPTTTTVTFELFNAFSAGDEQHSSGLLLATITQPDGTTKKGTVCDDITYERNVGIVVCQELGFAGFQGLDNPRSDVYNELQYSHDIVVDNLACRYTSDGLEGCTYDLQEHNCEHSEDVELTCTPSETGSIEFELFSLSEEQGEPTSGGLLIAKITDTGGRITKGTVCDDTDTKLNAGNVICRELGFSGLLEFGSAEYNPEYSATQTTLNIVVDDLNCEDAVGGIEDCTAVLFDHDCSHSEDIFINCLTDACTGLPNIANLITTAEFPVSSGSVVTVTCGENYSLIGQNTITCQQGTLFDFTQQPACVIDTCSGLPNIANLITTSEFPVSSGSVVTVTCGENYSLIGQRTMICWKGTLFTDSAQQPECVSEDCAEGYIFDKLQGCRSCESHECEWANVLEFPVPASVDNFMGISPVVFKTADVTRSVSVSVWFKIADDNNSGWLFSYMFSDGGHGLKHFGFGLNEDNRLTINVDTDKLTVGFKFKTDTWYHLVIVLDCSNKWIKVYVDGKKKKQKNGLGDLYVHGNGTLVLGQDQSGYTENHPQSDDSLLVSSYIDNHSFHPNKAFAGELAGLNWINSLLSNREVGQVYQRGMRRRLPDNLLGEASLLWERVFSRQPNGNVRGYSWDGSEYDFGPEESTLPTPHNAAMVQICAESHFINCVDLALSLDETRRDFGFRIKSVRLLSELLENYYLMVTSDKDHNTYIIDGYYADADLTDGISQPGFHLESDGGTTIVAIYYSRGNEAGTMILTSPATIAPTTVPYTAEEILPTEVSYETVAPTEFKVENSTKQVKELFDNTIVFETITVDDPQSKTDQATINIWKPDFNGSSIPIKALTDKSVEYTNSKTDQNLLGFLTYNGFTDYGITKSKMDADDRRLQTATIDPEDSVNEETMVEIIKSYQKFNGLPETGVITENNLEHMNKSRCGNKDVNYQREQNTFSCYESDGEIRSGDWNATCPDPEDRFDLCALYPKYRRFMWKDSYYFEADVEFLSRNRIDNKNPHLGLAYNYNSNTRKADHIYIKLEADLQRLCFSYGKFDNGNRTHVGWPDTDCVDLTEDQALLQQFKFRLSVDKFGNESLATFYVNGERVFTYTPIFETKSSVFIFTLGGIHFTWNEIIVFTSRVCKRNIEQRSTGLSRSRGKRYILSNYKWYPNGQFITYAFVNYSTSLGEQGTRLEILKAIQTYADQTSLKFQEILPNLADVAQITFMFIKGKHADQMNFDTAGKEKAHAFSPVHGEIHFNDHESFSINNVGKRHASLFYITLHELGHAMGLAHSEIKNAVMNEEYDHEKAYRTTQLDFDDTKALTNQYIDEIRFGGSHRFIDGIRPGNINENYTPRLPLPGFCHASIEAAFYFYSRASPSEDKIYIMTNGYLWRYGAKSFIGGSGPDKTYPKRTAEVFTQATGVIDAAFDTGKTIFIIIGERVLQYSVDKFYGIEQIVFQKSSTLEDAFLGVIPNTETIMSAFNHKAFNSKTCKKKKQICVKTTLIVSPGKRYEISWKTKGKEVASVQLMTSGVEVIGEQFPATQFGAAFEWTRRMVSGNSFEVMQFDTYRTCRTRVPYPGVSYQPRSGGSDVPELFRLAGWCIANYN